MGIEERIMLDLTPGMKLSIKGAASRYRVAYSTAQKALRGLWRAEFLFKEELAGGKLLYEGKQERLL